MGTTPGTSLHVAASTLTMVRRYVILPLQFPSGPRSLLPFREDGLFRVFSRLTLLGLAVLPGCAAVGGTPDWALPQGAAEAWQAALAILAAVDSGTWLLAGGSVALVAVIGFALRLRKRKDGPMSAAYAETPDSRAVLTTGDAPPSLQEGPAVAGVAGSLRTEEEPAAGPPSAGPPSTCGGPEGGDVTAAREPTDSLETERRRAAEALVAMGQEAAWSGEREKAYRLMRQALEMDPRNVDAWIWLAATSESVRESITCLETALLLDPDDCRAKRGLAVYRARFAEESKER